MVAPSKISEKWECLLIRVSRSYKMATVFGLSPFGFLHWRIFAVGPRFFFLPFCPHYRAYFQATTVSHSPTLGLTYTQMLTRGTASKINFYGWMALPHNSHNNGDNGLKPGLLSLYRCRVDVLQISMCHSTWYSPTLGGATGIQNLEKNDLSALCKNTFMTLNLTRN